MNFLFKALLVVIVGTLLGNAEGVTYHLNSVPSAAKALTTDMLDFNNIASAANKIVAEFQPKIYKPQGYSKGKNLKYIYFNVANRSRKSILVKFQRATITADDNFVKSFNIFFPADGSQPTTADAEKFSCATVENDSITDWYVRAFGGNTGVALSLKKSLPVVDNGPRMGFKPVNALTARPTAKYIITTKGMGSKRAESFWKDFRKIASNREGRVLLYRILIEIRRKVKKNMFEWNAGISSEIKENTSQYNIILRANCRSLTIVWSNEGNLFSGYEHVLSYNSRPVKSTTVCKQTEDTYSISLFKTESHIALFHEMLHWFHVLRHPERYFKESIAFGKPINVSLHDTNVRETIGGYFWGGLVSNKANAWKVSATPWLDYSATESYVNFEEIRTILGAPIPSKYRKVVPNNPIQINTYKFLNGDDLSENKYRVSIGAKLRFGHGTQPFYEDSKVIEKVIDVSGANDTNIVTPVEYTFLHEECRPECKKGLGDFQAGGYNISDVLP